MNKKSQNMKGIYIMATIIDNDTDIRCGGLGYLHFRKGYYLYIGSALGKGGFKRVNRHFDIASGKNPVRKWHIDYLLPHSRVAYAILFPTDKYIECIIAKTVAQFTKDIDGFGCTGCECKSHLLFSDTDLKDVVIDACKNLIECDCITITP